MTKYILMFTDGYDISLRGVYDTIDEAEEVMTEDYNVYGGANVPEEWLSLTYITPFDAQRVDGENHYIWKIEEIKGE